MHLNIKKTLMASGTAFLLFLAMASAQGTEKNASNDENTDFEQFGQFDDSPLSIEIIHPPWFKESFLDLKEDVHEAIKQNKKGIIVYFGQKQCAYCKALMENDFGQEDIATYTQEHFDVISINIWGSREVTLPDGQVMTEREYAIKENANLTPSLIFYTKDQKTGLIQKTFMLRGYYPPYKFRAALEYVIEDYYLQESFADYIDRADPPPKFELGDINEEDFFMPPPYALDRSVIAAEKPLLVFFEQKDCYACDVLHSEPLHHPETQRLLQYFDLVQLDIKSDTPVWTPDGEKTTARKWAKKLQLFYTPTIIAFDEKGKEIIRIDSVAHVYRLRGVLEFIASQTYKTAPNFMSWRFQMLAADKKLPETYSIKKSEE